MEKEEIERIANLESTPKFVFGSKELDEFHKQRKSANGTYRCYSDPCVVIHHSLIDGSVMLRVLSFLDYGKVVPRIYDL
jgi:hypothetical protein